MGLSTLRTVILVMSNVIKGRSATPVKSREGRWVLKAAQSHSGKKFSAVLGYKEVGGIR